ncbi:SMP-30/gluconolactonase/LRE family protein [Ancylobacter terrae]|uniref:SMP-30/gluconolactonase/LRE family protein n=1 Tax=Ancylobacter sp. sgz301288 TaxID=3342077 RepID=UPI0038594863
MSPQAIIPGEPEAESVATTRLDAPRCQLGEGPTYDPATGIAWWFDIVGKRLVAADLAAGTVQVHELPFMGSVLARVDAARQLVAGDDGLYLRDGASGRLSLHTPLEADNRSTRSNDGRVHPCGALWIGTMGRHAEPGAGAIYHFFRGELRRLYAGITVPNAICFASDGRTGYFTDTPTAILQRVALDPATGLPVGDPVPLYDHRGGIGGLDGAVVDAEGLIWNARWGAGRVDAYTPEGRRVRTVTVPARQSSCPAFVGARLDRLLVTSAWQGMDQAARAADPHHGLTFVLDVGAIGRPEPRLDLGAA